ncbi:hypothetical protein GCM10009779_34430 [Polymorphospora rubra]|uniref:Uncharacterized protein n=1 Tax=Polymorphospora rubra TaxID=338584 RepID=A0A810NEB9_9ACTN|nr:hypothetical protein Prubr_74300 [Polymorphospora rubra]
MTCLRLRGRVAAVGPPVTGPLERTRVDARPCLLVNHSTLEALEVTAGPRFAVSGGQGEHAHLLGGRGQEIALNGTDHLPILGRTPHRRRRGITRN